MKIINTDKAPEAIGPYSQGVIVNGLLFVSGQIPFDPTTGQKVEGGVKEQTTQVLKNLEAIIIEAGANLENVVKCNVYLADMGQFSIMNEVYGSFFKNHKPARAAIEAARLPRDVLVEIEAIVEVG